MLVPFSPALPFSLRSASDYAGSADHYRLALQSPTLTGFYRKRERWERERWERERWERERENRNRYRHRERYRESR
jgi:hypothetical protein